MPIGQMVHDIGCNLINAFGMYAVIVCAVGLVALALTSHKEQ